MSLISVTILSTQIVFAEEEIKKDWMGEGELGITHTSGNTKNQNVITKLKLTYERDLWKHEAKLDVLRTEDADKLTAEHYGFNWQSDYTLSEKDYIFGKFRYEDDSFTGYNYQSSISTGYGYKVFKNDIDSLKLEAGVGISMVELEDVATESDQEAIGILGLNYTRKIGSHTEFTQDFLVEASSENIHSKSDSGLKVNITNKVALKLSLLIKSNSEVPSGKEKTDTISAVTLVYNF
ncbi:MAG: DUF481 domain-containing protein [Candidatus Marithrix sp.]|nr:DUF481 domain-containing protein [Candidatus Marithrix sp.]